MPAPILIFLLTGCSCGQVATPETGTVTEARYGADLAERFCPVFFLKGDGDAAENYEPAPIETLVSQAVFLEAGNLEFSDKASLPGMKEYSASSYYLDVPGLSPASAPGILPDYKHDYDTLIQSGYQPTVYARILENVNDELTVLQYWTFYYFNDWRNVHEGDWELVQLVFPGLPAQEILSGAISPFTPPIPSTRPASVWPGRTCRRKDWWRVPILLSTWPRVLTPTTSSPDSTGRSWISMTPAWSPGNASSPRR